MKQKLFGAAALAAFILVGASCAKQEQSEFNLNSVKQEVTISATVTYSTGVDVNATSYSIINSKPAAGRKVFIEVPYGDYSAGAAVGAGDKIFETVTDENGKFTITIPTTSAGVNATIRMEEFTDVYRTYEKMDANGKPVFKTELRNYSFSIAAPGLKPGAFRFPKEIVYDSEKIDVDQFDENVTMTGSVNLAYETAFRKGAFKPANKANVEFTIVYDAGTTNELELKFGTVTDANGNYTISLPVKSLADGFQIKALKVLGIGDNQFTHYISDTASVKVYGAYDLQNFGNFPAAPGANIVFKDIISGVTYNLGAQNLLFTPYYNASITDADQAKPEKWEDNLIGWAAGMAGYDESFSQTATLTGKVYMPYLKAFGEGAYKNECRTIILTSTVAPYTTGLAVITDKNGNFSVDIPVKNDNPITFTAKLSDDDKALPFEFIDSKDKRTFLRKGSYDTNTQIKKEGAEWYELGDFYFHYTPDAGETPDEWNKYLIGWYKDAKYDKPVQVKGKILFAVEEAFGVGVYEAQPRIVTVTATQGTDVRTFAIKADATTGAYDFMLPLEDEHDQPNMAVTSTTYKTNEFVHYPKYASSDTKLLEGTYSVYRTTYDTKEEKEAWNDLGTKYMKILKASLTHATSTYHDNLAGWFKRVEGTGTSTPTEGVVWASSTKASGVAKMSKETAFLTGEYIAAKGQLVTITLYTNEAAQYQADVTVLTNNDGSFSFAVPLRNPGDETKLAVSATTVDEDHFEHYTNAAGKKQILTGSFTGKSIKPEDAEWNELGTVYYKFAPKSADEFWTNYVQYISGWAYVEGRNVRTQNVTGKVYLPQETSFRNGSYTPAKRFPVKIRVGASAPYTYYVAATDTLGNYEIPVWQKFAGDVETVTWMDPVLTTDELDFKFIHYRKPGTTTTEKLSGKFAAKETLRKGDAKWYQRGDRYYKFYDPTDATLFTLDLAGWEVKPLDWTHTLTIKGSVKQASEKVDGTTLVSTWENCSNNIFTVNVTGYGSFKVATSSSGNFQFNVYDTNTDEPASLTVSITRDEVDTYFKTTTFKHYKSATQQTTISGEYKVAAYTPSQTKEGANTNWTYTMDHSFKLTFTPTSDPSNWGDFSWSGKYSDEE